MNRNDVIPTLLMWTLALLAAYLVGFVIAGGLG